MISQSTLPSLVKWATTLWITSTASRACWAWHSALVTWVTENAFRFRNRFGRSSEEEMFHVLCCFVYKCFVCFRRISGPFLVGLSSFLIFLEEFLLATRLLSAVLWETSLLPRTLSLSGTDSNKMNTMERVFFTKALIEFNWLIRKSMEINLKNPKIFPFFKAERKTRRGTAAATAADTISTFCACCWASPTSYTLQKEKLTSQWLPNPNKSQEKGCPNKVMFFSSDSIGSFLCGILAVFQLHLQRFSLKRIRGSINGISRHLSDHRIISIVFWLSSSGTSRRNHGFHVISLHPRTGPSWPSSCVSTLFCLWARATSLRRVSREVFCSSIFAASKEHMFEQFISLSNFWSSSSFLKTTVSSRS